MQVEQLQQQLKDAHEKHTLTKEESDGYQSQLRQSQSEIRQLQSDKNVLEERIEHQKMMSKEKDASLISLQKQFTVISAENETHVTHEKLLKENLQKTDVQINEIQFVVNECNDREKKHLIEIDELKQNLLKVETEKQTLSKNNYQLTSNIQKNQVQMVSNHADHETDVRRTMEEMEARFVLSETELKKSVEKKTMELERALQRIHEMEERGSSNNNSSNSSNRTSEQRTYEVERLKVQMTDLESQLERYRNGKIQLLESLELSKQKTLAAIREQ